jgi:hypothetical protein
MTSPPHVLSVEATVQECQISPDTPGSALPTNGGAGQPRSAQGSGLAG